MKIRITKGRMFYWYENKVGQVFDVRSFVEGQGYFVRGDDTDGMHVFINLVKEEDCEVIEQP